MTQMMSSDSGHYAVYAEKFAAAKPFKYVVIEDFLDRALCQRMLDDFPRFEDRYALNEMGEVGRKAVRTDVRDVSVAYREIDDYLQSQEFLRLVSGITGIPDLLYDPDYIGGGTHENRDGQCLEQHVDFNFHPGTRWHRRLNLIVYLNSEWDEAWGGNLQLQADPWNGDPSGPSIAPLFNRAVIFETTEKSWHGFSAIHLPDERKSVSRKSFAIYLYTKERPAAQTAVSHATVYVPEGMPSSLQAGTTLDHAHVTDLRQRFDRLRGLLRFLYEREKNFSAEIQALDGALKEAQAGLRLPLQGYATQPQAPSGIWSDGWVGEELVCNFIPERKIRALELELWVSDKLDANQTLDLELDGKRWQHHIARGSRSHIVLELKRSAGVLLELRVRAAQVFEPVRVGSSTDERRLAWKLIAAGLRHG
jgi:2OG-Fe(II) oxygenase superfamily